MESWRLCGGFNEGRNGSELAGWSQALEEISTHFFTNHIPNGTMLCTGWRWKHTYVVYTWGTPRTSSCKFRSLLYSRRGPEVGVWFDKAQIWEDLENVQQSIHIKKNCNSWRMAPNFFRAEDGWRKPGSASMAPAWFQQAHEVGVQVRKSDRNLTFCHHFSCFFFFRSQIVSKCPRRSSRNIPRRGWTSKCGPRHCWEEY